jgi:hypothetical protein
MLSSGDPGAHGAPINALTASQKVLADWFYSTSQGAESGESPDGEQGAAGPHSIGARSQVMDCFWDLAAPEEVSPPAPPSWPEPSPEPGGHATGSTGA